MGGPQDRVSVTDGAVTFRDAAGLELGVRVAVASAEGPPALRERADLVVESPGAGDPHKVRTRVVVDAIASTSAGGINGVYLAKALAHNRSQDPLRDSG
jgi:hypothetical protein